MPARRRSKKTRTRKPKGNEEDENDPSAPPSKRHETSEDGTPGPSMSGKRTLSVLPAMPLDVLYNVFKHLVPPDLIRLSRTTKTLRRLLLSRDWEPVWRAAISNVPGLPTCATTMSPVRYACLAFSNRCFFCPAPRAINLLWELQVRCCNKCVCSADDIVRDDFFQTECLGEECTQGVIEAIKTAAVWRNIDLGKYSGRLYVRSELLELRNTVLGIAGDSTALKEFVAERQVHFKCVTLRAGRCEAWYRDWCKKQAKTPEATLQRREEAIIERLSEIGWQPYLRIMTAKKLRHETYSLWYDAFRKHAAVAKPKDLTQHAWLKIKHTVVDFMEAFKKKSDAHELDRAGYHRSVRVNATLRAYVMARPIEESHPTIGDLDEMGALRGIMDWHVVDADLDDIPGSLFTYLKERLPELSVQWRHSVALSLLARLPAIDMADSPDLSRLQLATSLFKCSYKCSARKPLTHANLLHHPCVRPGVNMDPLEVDKQGYRRGSRWSQQTDISYNAPSAAIASTLVKMCGLDPATATQADMDALGARFTCSGCHDDNKGAHWRKPTKRIALDWRGAVFHFHWDSNQRPVELFRLPSPATAFAKSREAVPTLGLDRSGYPYTRWTCTRCRMCHSAHTMPRHLFQEHGVRESTPEDYTLALDHFDVPESFRVWIPLYDDNDRSA